jgi:hypothetical protein
MRKYCIDRLTKRSCTAFITTSELKPSSFYLGRDSPEARRREFLENVRKYLGHKSIASTGAYLQVDDDQASRAITGAAKA